MSRFQFVAISSIVVIIAWEVWLWRSVRPPSRVSIARTAVWLAAVLAIAQPAIVQHVANSVGVGRGTDIMLYVLILSYLGTSFYLYAKCIHLQRQITRLARATSIKGARRGGRGIHLP